jgi:hypothetical protein
MSRRLCLLWLMLALLPLRGWAVATMAAPSPATMAVQQQATETGDTGKWAVAVMPCHEATDSGDEATSAGNACTLCDLCHSAVTVHSIPLLAGALPPDAMPRPRVARDTGRNAAGGLERPPRLNFA